jgi:hypothetical protein
VGVRVGVGVGESLELAFRVGGTWCGINGKFVLPLTLTLTLLTPTRTQPHFNMAAAESTKWGLAMEEDIVFSCDMAKVEELVASTLKPHKFVSQAAD